MTHNTFPVCSADFLIAHVTDEYLYIIDTSFITNSVTAGGDITNVVKYLYNDFDLGEKRLI